MMKFKHLFDNRDLTFMLLKNWDYNDNKIECLNDFRISSNAVYPVYIGGVKCFLRFAPTDEKVISHVKAELEFLKYLYKMKYKCVETVPTKDGRELVVSNTPWGNYIAVVFKGVNGKPLTQIEYTQELYFGFGKSLANLHKLSGCYRPVEATRPDWKQQLDWCEKLLRQYETNDTALIEINLLRGFFSKLPQTHNNYGLVHYDFESQNVFYDSKTKEFCPIDFDDSIYHWFIIDIDRSIRAIKNTLDQKYADSAVLNFMSGYRSEVKLSDNELALRPVFKRFCDLYGYTKRLRSLHDKWENEPEWMVVLRNRLTVELSDKVCCFGKKIEL